MMPQCDGAVLLCITTTLKPCYPVSLDALRIDSRCNRAGIIGGTITQGICSEVDALTEAAFGYWFLPRQLIVRLTFVVPAGDDIPFLQRA